MVPKIPRHVSKFIESIASIASEGVEIWVMGSRANGRARPDSDTDLLVFGPDGFFESIRARLSQPEDVDCLVDYDGNNYKDPWQEKSGSLSRLKWKITDDKAATYVGTKWVPDEKSSAKFQADMGELVERDERAYRVWP